jgi:hypothetical protein
VGDRKAEGVRKLEDADSKAKTLDSSSLIFSSYLFSSAIKVIGSLITGKLSQFL